MIGCPLLMASDFCIRHVAPDICDLSLGSHLVDMTETEKHRENALENPTVLGELFDQMILAEGFYLSGPVRTGYSAGFLLIQPISARS
jgi:hypothetical protein